MNNMAQMREALGTRPDHQPLQVGSRTSPLALVQARTVLKRLAGICGMDVFQEHVIPAIAGGTAVRRPAELGSKRLSSREIHQALRDGHIDLAVHSVKDLELDLPPGIVLACTLSREDARDVLVLGRTCGTPDQSAPFTALPKNALVATSSIRRQAQLLHQRSDLRFLPAADSVQTGLAALHSGQCDASLLASSMLRRLGLDVPNAIVLEPETMVPAAAQGIIGITVRARDTRLVELLQGIEDLATRVAATAERSVLTEFSGSCRTPVGAYATMLPDGRLTLTGMVARADGSFLAKRSLTARPSDADRLGQTLGTSLRADSPEDIFD
jgi:hydroxymethylbilane synthase